MHSDLGRIRGRCPASARLHRQDITARRSPMRHHDSRALFVVLMLGLLVPPLARARNHIVQPGDSIRAALAQAQPGDRITVLPGVYREGAADDPSALTVTQDGIALV